MSGGSAYIVDKQRELGRLCGVLLCHEGGPFLRNKRPVASELEILMVKPPAEGGWNDCLSPLHGRYLMNETPRAISGLL